MTEPEAPTPGRLFHAPAGFVELFDVDEMTDAVAAPAVQFRGRLHVAKKLSFAEYQTRLAPLLSRIDSGGAVAVLAILEAFRLFYPRKWWQFWKPDVARALVETMPPAELGRLLAGFLVSARGRAPAPTTKPKPGAASAPETPRAWPPVAVPFPTLSPSPASSEAGSAPISSAPANGTPATD